MENEVFDVNNVSVQMMMVIHIQSIKRIDLSTLTYSDLEMYLSDCLWKKYAPRSLHEAADDVLHVTANDIVRYLSKIAVMEGAGGNLADFRDLLGG